MLKMFCFSCVFYCINADKHKYLGVFVEQRIFPFLPFIGVYCKVLKSQALVKYVALLRNLVMSPLLGLKDKKATTNL